ncbi:unnamed protein product [Allacma fusca]|uniref:Uncharacterized protein n=1 Tax=Allacma fusca TaxID=39272 RepID=A0A8J2KJS2_9HEXA|nr:unnamed protein product [Allacma fusca]
MNNPTWTVCTVIVFFATIAGTSSRSHSGIPHQHHERIQVTLPLLADYLSEFQHSAEHRLPKAGETDSSCTAKVNMTEYDSCGLHKHFVRLRDPQGSALQFLPPVIGVDRCRSLNEQFDCQPRVVSKRLFHVKVKGLSSEDCHKVELIQHEECQRCARSGRRRCEASGDAWDYTQCQCRQREEMNEVSP